jgi:hypothetical protein
MQNEEEQMAHNRLNGLTKKQTAVEFLYQKMFENQGRILKEDYEQAKEMEKQQIIDACKRGYKRDSFTPNFREQQELFEQYYNETFKKK